MPVSFVAAASGDGGASSALTATCVMPSGAQAGDAAVVIGCSERGSGVIPVISGVTGWTALINIDDSTQMAVFIGWKTVQPGDPGTTITATVSTGRRLAVGVAVYRGVDSANVATAISSATTSTANGSGVNDVTTPSVTPDLDDAWVVGVIGWVRQSSPWTSVNTAASPATERIDDVSTSASSTNAGVWVADKAISNGGGASQSGVTMNGDTNVRFFAASVALSPAESAAGRVFMAPSAAAMRAASW